MCKSKIVENCFGYSGDTLGSAVQKHVDAVGKLTVEINRLPSDFYNVDYLNQLLFDVNRAHIALYEHLIQCGIRGTANEIVLGENENEQ